MKWIKRTAVREQLNNLIMFVIESMESDLLVSGKLITEVRLICEEVLMNAIDYSYPDNQGDIEVGYEYDRDIDMITLVFKDQGIEFNPTQKEDPDLTVDIMDRQIGGLGIFMIKKLSDTVVYERQEDTNVLTVRKCV